MKRMVPVGQIHAFMSLPQRTDGNRWQNVLQYISASLSLKAKHTHAVSFKINTTKSCGIGGTA